MALDDNEVSEGDKRDLRRGLYQAYFNLIHKERVP